MLNYVTYHSIVWAVLSSIILSTNSYRTPITCFDFLIFNLVKLRHLIHPFPFIRYMYNKCIWMYININEDASTCICRIWLKTTDCIICSITIIITMCNKFTEFKLRLTKFPDSRDEKRFFWEFICLKLLNTMFICLSRFHILWTGVTWHELLKSIH